MSSSTESSSGKTCEFSANVEALRQVPVFAKLPIGFVKGVAFGCDRKTYRTGADLFSQGDTDDRAYHIISGEVELVHLDPEGEIVVRTFGEGDFIGGLALLGDVKRLYSLRAREETAAILLTRGKVQAEMAKSAEYMPRFLTAVAGAVVKWEESHVARAGGCAACMGHIGASVL